MMSSLSRFGPRLRFPRASKVVATFSDSDGHGLNSAANARLVHSSQLANACQSIRLLSTEDSVSQLLKETAPEEMAAEPKDFSSMTNEELADTSTIPGWEFIHSPPGGIPRGVLVGKVVSDKMDKTVNVAVDRYRMVPKYRKRLKYTRKFMAHDENEVAKMGDLVMITPCHRISKHKHFMLREIVRAKGQLY